LKIKVYPHGLGKGVKAVRTFCAQDERGSIYCNFVRTSLKDSP